MYQPDEALAAFEIPSARETRDQDAPPFHGCPDDPGRECMMRYLYARKKNQAVKCAHCGIVAARVSNFYKAKDRQERLAAVSKKTTPKILTPEQIARRREIALANLAKAQEKNSSETDAERKARKREIAIANLKKGEARRQEILAEGRRLRAEALERKKEEKRLRRLERQGVSPADKARAEVKAEMQDVRDGHKNPSRIQGVVLVLEWYMKNGVERVSLLDLSYRFNAIKGTISTRGGVLGRSLRRYGLKVRGEYNDALRGQRVYVYIDDTARKFVEDEFVFHTHARGRIKR